MTVTTVQSKPVMLTQQYVGKIRGHLHINVRTPATGTVTSLPITTGQAVKKDDVLFQIQPKIDNGQSATANDMFVVRAPFDGLVGELPVQEGSVVLEGETLTSLTDNSLMWVYFTVPEAKYLDYQAADLDHHRDEVKLELVLNDGTRFDQPGKLGAIDADFNTETGGVAFRADFPNPNLVLRHGQTGIVSLGQEQQNALIVPQKATFEILGKRYVFVVDSDDIAHQTEIIVQNGFDDTFVVKSGVSANDKIVVDGIRSIHDGEKVRYDDHPNKMAATVD